MKHWFSQPWHCRCRVVYEARPNNSVRVVGSDWCRRAWSAHPMAPISSGRLLRDTSLPVSFSKARTTESFFIVPPCTTMFCPNSSVFFRRNTLYRQFFTTEYERPAAMSDTVAPSRIACLTFEFINTVQRVPKSYGWTPRQASAPNSCAE